MCNMNLLFEVAQSYEEIPFKVWYLHFDIIKTTISTVNSLYWYYWNATKFDATSF